MGTNNCICGERRFMLDRIIDRHDLAALIFWRPDELVLLTGYMPLWGLSFLVYRADGQAYLFVPELEPEDLLPEGVIIRKFPWGVIDEADPWKMLYAAIRALLKEKALLKKPVSFIGSIGGTAPCRMTAENPPLPMDLLEKLKGVTDNGFKDTVSDLLDLYQYKTECDLQGLLLAHSVTRAATDIFYKGVKAGVCEIDLAAEIEYGVQKLSGKGGVSFAKAWPLVMSGINTAQAGYFNRSTGKTLESGDLVLLEMAVCTNGYWTDITRMACVGQADTDQQEMYDVIKSAQKLAMDMLRPGVNMRDIDGAARHYIERKGFGMYFNHALGHQVGFRYHDPGEGLSPYSSSVVKEGMVLTIEPGIYSPELEGGIRIEENVFITEDGYRLLSDYSNNDFVV